MKTQEFNFKWGEKEEKTFGPIVLKKMNYLEKCSLQGKVLKVNIKQVNGINKETTYIDTGAIPFWSVVHSIHSLPKYPNFHELPEEKKADIVSYLGCGEDEPENLGGLIFDEARQINPFDSMTTIKKK